MKRKLLITFFILLIVQSGYSQALDKIKLDTYFQALEASNKFMGSVAIAKAGQVIYTKAIGFKVVEDKARPDEHTKYRIGSISKTITAVLILKAVEENKIILSQAINSYFPTIKNADRITILQLLNHHSGIHNFTNDAEYMKWYTQEKSEEELVKIISAIGSDFEPGSKGEYSNSNYVLLSFILQKLYNKSYADILKERIIKPLGLKDTYYGGKINTNNNESHSYKLKGDWVKEIETDMSIPVGAGAVVSTPVDLTNFAYALFNGKIISGESLKQMQTLEDGYGLGLFQMPFHEKKSFGHNGGIDGFSSVFSYFPEDEVSFALTSNGSAYDNNSIVITLLNSVYNKPYQIPNFKTLTAADLDQYLGVYADKSFPMKITVTKEGNTLKAQATGQPAFELEALAENVFRFQQAGLELHFKPAAKQMTLKQGGRDFLLTKE